MRNAGFPFNALPFSTQKTTLYSSAVAFVSFYLSLKTSSYSFSFEVEAHYGWEKNFGSISTEVASHTHFLSPYFVVADIFESFIRNPPPPFFFVSLPLNSLPFVSFTVKCWMIHIKKLLTHDLP